jgi:hypothetical protein
MKVTHAFISSKYTWICINLKHPYAFCNKMNAVYDLINMLESIGIQIECDKRPALKVRLFLPFTTLVPVFCWLPFGASGLCRGAAYCLVILCPCFYLIGIGFCMWNAWGLFVCLWLACPLTVESFNLTNNLPIIFFALVNLYQSGY